MNTETVKEFIFSKSSDDFFEKIYGGDFDTTKTQKERYFSCAENFKKLFGAERTDVFSAPGRSELCGNHTDHNMGKVLAAAVDMDMIGAAAVNGTDKVRVYSDGFGFIGDIDLTDTQANPREYFTAKAIVKGVCRAVKSKGFAISGFDCCVHSLVPVGSGLSSSAAFEVLICSILNDFFCENKLTAMDMAKMARYRENVYFGKPSGLMDQAACSMGGVAAIDFSGGGIKRKKVSFDIDSSGMVMCIVNTGTSHHDLTDRYSAIKSEMCAVAQLFDKKYLGDLDRDVFFENIPFVREKLGDRAVMRRVHFYNECQRADAAALAAEKGDIFAFLAVVNSSGHSSFEYNQNVCLYSQPTQQATALAICIARQILPREQSAVRIHGGGFAGTIQCFMPKECMDDFRKKMEKIFGTGCCHFVNIRQYGAVKLGRKLP